MDSGDSRRKETAYTDSIMLSPSEIKKRAIEFAREHESDADEKSQAQNFWRDFFAVWGLFPLPVTKGFREPNFERSNESSVRTCSFLLGDTMSTTVVERGLRVEPVAVHEWVENRIVHVALCDDREISFPARMSA